MKATKKQFIAILKKYRGMQTYVADALGITAQAVSQRIKKDAEIKEIYEQVLEQQIDFVESKLFHNIDKGDTTACIFFLKCKAKNRGYIERQEITGMDGAPLTQLIAPARYKEPTEWEQDQKP